MRYDHCETSTWSFTIINHTHGSTVTEMSENKTNRIQDAYVPLHLHDYNIIVNHFINKFYKSVKNAFLFCAIYIYIYIYIYI